MHLLGAHSGNTENCSLPWRRLEEAGINSEISQNCSLPPLARGGGDKKLSSSSIEWIQSAAEHRGGSSEPSRMTAQRRWHGAVTQRAVRTLKSRWGEGGGRVGYEH